MKAILISFLFLTGVQLHAQEVEIKEESLSIDDYSGVGFQVNVHRAEKDEIEKEWKKIMKDYDGKVDINRNHTIVESAIIPSIGTETIKIVSEIEEKNKLQKHFNVLFMINSISLNSKSDVAATVVIKDILERFAKELSEEATKDHLDDQEKLLSKMQGDLKDMKNDEEKARKAIEEAKETIKEKTNEIEDLKKAQIDKAKEIEQQQKKVSEVEQEHKLFK